MVLCQSMLERPCAFPAKLLRQPVGCCWCAGATSVGRLGTLPESAPREAAGKDMRWGLLQASSQQPSPAVCTLLGTRLGSIGLALQKKGTGGGQD